MLYEESTSDNIYLAKFFVAHDANKIQHPADLLTLIWGCLDTDYICRYTIEDIMEHPWIAGAPDALSPEMKAEL